MLNQTEKRNMKTGLFNTIKTISNENPLSLIENYQRKKQLSITKSGKTSNSNLINGTKNVLKTQNEKIISKRKEISELLQTSKRNERNKSKSMYEGSSFLSPNNNRIVGELDIIRWRHNLNKLKVNKF
jgi:hypothetical protein